jgi:hypothetical protein
MSRRKIFSLTDIAALDCDERFLSIEFEVTSSVVFIGFIDSNSNEIYLKQENSKICSKLKVILNCFSELNILILFLLIDIK